MWIHYHCLMRLTSQQCGLQRHLGQRKWWRKCRAGWCLQRKVTHMQLRGGKHTLLCCGVVLETWHDLACARDNPTSNLQVQTRCAEISIIVWDQIILENTAALDCVWVRKMEQWGDVQREKSIMERSLEISIQSNHRMVKQYAQILYAWCLEKNVGWATKLASSKPFPRESFDVANLLEV